MQFKHRWLDLFGKTWVTEIVCHGYCPEWISAPPLRIVPLSYRSYCQNELETLSLEINSLLNSGAIQEMDTKVPCFVSNLFLVSKKNGKNRPVIDLWNLNCFVKYHHFKMENIELVKNLLRREDF